MDCWPISKRFASALTMSQCGTRCSSIQAAKDILWRDCNTDLARLRLEKKLRQSSSTRSQELADLDDIIEAFDALDSDACLPEVVCSAEDLLQMPQLLPLRGAEQVAEDVRALHVAVCSRLEGINKRLQLPFPAPSVSENGSNTNLCSQSNSPTKSLKTTTQRQALILLAHLNHPDPDLFSSSSTVLGTGELSSLAKSGCQASMEWKGISCSQTFQWMNTKNAEMHIWHGKHQPVTLCLIHND